MSSKTSYLYDFNGLRFDIENSLLIRLDNQETISLRGKEKLLLLALIEKPNQIVSYEELQKAVWQDASETQMILRRLQVTKDTLQKKINQLRQTPDNNEVIKSIPLKGYVFTLPVEQPAIASAVKTEVFSSESAKIYLEEDVKAVTPSKFDEAEKTGFISVYANSRTLFIGSIFLGLGLLTLFLAAGSSPREEQRLRQVIKDSQMYESLVLYRTPANLDENKLKEYWIVEQHNGELDSTRIAKSAKNLAEKGNFYGPETKNERFDFVSIEINETGDFAVVRTIEKWFVSRYRKDGILIENKTIGPYAVTYNLRKIGGNWLIEKSSTARAAGN